MTRHLSIILLSGLAACTLAVLPVAAHAADTPFLSASFYPAHTRLIANADVANTRMDCDWSFACPQGHPLTQRPIFHFTTEADLQRISGWAQFGKPMLFAIYAHGDRGARAIALHDLIRQVRAAVNPTVLLTGSSALARPQLNPALFALPASAFPAGSQVVRSSIETNRRLFLDDRLHFGIPPSATGRRSGYYMDAVEGDPASPSHPYTSYLVSIFHSAHEARIAYDIRWQSWFVADFYTTPQAAPITVGSHGYEALFRSFDPSSLPLTELFFVRGRVLVEVFQATGDRPATADELQSFYAITRSLDNLARQHPLGA